MNGLNTRHPQDDDNIVPSVTLPTKTAHLHSFAETDFDCEEPMDRASNLMAELARSKALFASTRGQVAVTLSN